jgi:hypothetical protein
MCPFMGPPLEKVTVTERVYSYKNVYQIFRPLDLCIGGLAESEQHLIRVLYLLERWTIN